MISQPTKSGKALTAKGSPAPRPTLLWSICLTSLMAAHALLFSLPASAQQDGTIAGVVTDSTSGETLPGVNIQLVGTQRGAATDVEGRYTLEGVEPGVYDVRASFIGYLPRTVTGVEVDAGEVVELNLRLLESAIELDEVVAIGYGTTRKTELTGAIVSIDQEELVELPTSNVLESLQGEVAGLDITNQSGETGAGLNFTVRGNRSLAATNNPLFIVDGVQYGNISHLNPNDVTSIDVLKDAASTAIYGARGANGVVLITTKKGTTGDTQVSFNSHVGVTQSTGFPPQNTAEQFVQLKREAHRAVGEWSSPADDPNIFSATELRNYQNGIATDFADLLLRDGLQQNYQVGVATGSDRTRAYLSGSFFEEAGILEMDHLQRSTLRLNVSHKISDMVEVGTNTQVSYADQDRRRNPLHTANTITPLVAAFDESGDLIKYPEGSTTINPLVDELPNAFEDNAKTVDLRPTLFLELSPTRNLTFRSDAAFGLETWRQGIFRASDTIDRNGQPPEARYLTSNNRGINLENVLTYSNYFDEHSVQLTGVLSYLGNQRDFASALGQGQLLAQQLYYGLGNAPEGVAIESGYVESSLLSYAGRLNYGWREKYLLTLTGRADGSSRLSEGNKWAFFPSIAAAWRIGEERLMNRTSFSDLKLRVSYGVSGNDAVAPYATQAELVRIPWGFGESTAPGYAFSSRAGNPNLEWEISQTVNVGLDMGLWNNRVYATLDVYNTNTSDLLLERFLPQSSGVASVVQNVGETRNRGIELSLQTQNIVRENLLWQTDLTFFANDEEIVALTGEGDDIANGWFIGHPTNVFYDYEKIGIWQLDEADEAMLHGQEPGELKVRDQNGDGMITPDDRIVLGTTRPDWSGSIQNKLYIGNFDFTAVIYARVGQLMQYEYYGNYRINGVWNGSALDYWTPENPTNAFPRPTARYSQENYRYYDSMTYEDASFVKLRNVTVGYTLPERLTNRLFADHVRIYLSGKNLWTISGVDNYDPERGGGLSFPMTRLFVGGLDINF